MMKIKKAISLLLTLSMFVCVLFNAGLSVNAADADLTLTAENAYDSDFNADSDNDRQKIIDLEKDLPDKLDLRDYNGKNYVTPVKNQNPYGSCWAFAMAAAAEISYLYENDMGVPAGEVNDQVDFSEKYISWYMRHALTKDDVEIGSVPASQIGEGYDLSKVEKDNRNCSYDLPGNPLYGVNFYASGFGPVDESTVINGEQPYVYAGKNRWRNSDPDEVSEEFAKLRKALFYHEYKMHIYDLIIYNYIESADEFDSWFEANWKSGRNIYARSLKDGSYSTIDDWTLPLTAEYRNPEIQAYFKSSYLLPSPASKDDEGKYVFDRAGVAAIKSELSKGRGVSIGILADQSLPGDAKGDAGYLNTVTWAQYNNKNSDMNHLVTIVGYDDNYPKENFTRTVKGNTVAGSTPPENGAFIVKNSWGSLTDEDRKTAAKNEFGDTVYQSPNAVSWGIDDTGYFYLSYYDHSINTPTTFSFYDYDETEFYELNYDQYDMAQDVDYKELTYKDKRVQTANIFTAEEDEYLYQISAMVGKPMSKVIYKVYKDVKDTPESGKLIEQGEVTKQYAGYQRIDLSELTYLPEGTRYSVVITQEARNEKDEVYTPVTVGVLENYSANRGAVVKTVINKGESFINFGNAWEDFSTIKEQTELGFYNDLLSKYNKNSINEFYLNREKDFQLDNIPIKAFLVPARTVTEYMVGDADLDKDITVTDVTTIQRYDCRMISLSQPALLSADVDSDDEACILDATWLQRSLLDMKAPADIGTSYILRNED